MILDEFVEVSWCPSNKDHYVYLGLVFTKMGEKFKVRPEDLPNGSDVRVNFRCDTCDNKYSLKWSNYTRKKNKNECIECYNHDHATKQFDFIYGEFDKRGYDLLTTYYVKVSQFLEYRCRKHQEHAQKITYNAIQGGHGCYYCGVESRAAKRRITEKPILKLLTELNYKFYEFVLDGKPLSSTTVVKYICFNHPFDVQVSNYNSLQQGRRCPMCAADNRRYKFTPTKNTASIQYFRHHIVEWKELTENLCNHRCVLTGELKYVLHHHTPFAQILNEALSNVNLPKHKVAKQYTETELVTIIAELKKLHEFYGPGVCLSEILHVKLHSKYGRRKEITKEQFAEFCYLFHAGKILEKNRFLNFD